MWLHAFEWNDKIISETELLVLSVVPSDEFTPSTTIMEKLRDVTVEWTPKGGTVYPILNRFKDLGLLEKEGPPKSSSYKRSKDGDLFLSSIQKPLKTQIAESINYYNVLLKTILSLPSLPLGYEDTLNWVENLVKGFYNSLKDLDTEAKRRRDQESAFDVPITFE